MSGGDSSNAYGYDPTKLGQDIGSQLQTAIDTPYTPSATTTAAQDQTLATAGWAANGNYSNALSSAIDNALALNQGNGLTTDQSALYGTTASYASDYGNLANQYAGLSDWYSQDSPGYQTLRNNLANDTTTQIYSDLNNSGLFGSDYGTQQAATGLTNALASLDYTNYQNDLANQYASLQAQQGAVSAAQGATESAFNQGQTGVTNQQNSANQLASLYSALQAPYYDALAVGGMQDTASQTDWNQLLQALGAYSGATSSGVAGVTPDTSSSDWWATLLGAGLTTAGLLL